MLVSNPPSEMHLQPTEEMYRSGNGGPKRYAEKKQKGSRVFECERAKLSNYHSQPCVGFTYCFLGWAIFLLHSSSDAVDQNNAGDCPYPPDTTPTTTFRSFLASPLFFLLLAPDNDDVDDDDAHPLRNNVPFQLWIGIGVIDIWNAC